MARLPHDAYMTPPYYIAALLGEVNIWGAVFEPCVGDGAIAKALATLPSVKRVDTNDIDRKRKADYHFDAVKPWPFSQDFDWVVTNPPFSKEFELLKHLFSYGVPNIALLARLSFLEPTGEREYILGEQPPTRVIVLPRHQFRPPSKDFVTCVWLVWGGGCQPGVSVWSRGKSEACAAIRDL